jgi:anti-anti-sigma regulatory factor
METVAGASGITFIDSSGVRALMEGHYRATQLGKEFWVVDGSPSIRRVFELLELADALGRGPQTGEWLRVG